ncbi:hypothetical protein [Tardiphaga sp. 841_E9_N1_2]|jgi:hypothetical protein|uniref:hypothetical protein n=1 Tax=Tardiphaga sp. 841_E9_N1_2 TaxID=3240762 RepID=UPI003F26AF3E
MAGIQNLTEQTVFESGVTLGTGVFAIPDPLSGEFGAKTKIYVDSISYEECVRRGLTTVAFKWIPHKNGFRDPETKESKWAVARSRCVDR